MDELRLPSKNTIAEMAQLAEIGRNARIVFHDLSNHITALSLSVDQLRLRSEQTKNQIEYVSRLLRSHLEKTSNTNHTTFDPVEEIRNILGIFRDRAAKKNILVNFKAHRQIRLQGNQKIFVHIVANLIANAIDSFENQAKNNNKNIEIILVRDGVSAILKIRDNGCGISPENLRIIMSEPFTTKKSGHGLGLMAVKENIEEAFRGQIAVQSSTCGSNSGTTFVVSFPTVIDAKARPRNLRLKLKRQIRVTITETRQTSVAIQSSA